MARWTPFIFVVRAAAGIDTRQQTLGGGLFVACGAIDLTCEIQVFNGLGFKRGFQSAGIKVIVFNGITWTQYVRIFESNHGANQVDLHIKRQAGGNAIGIKLVRRQTFRLKKDLVLIFICKTMDFVFDGWAITRAYSFNDPRVHGGTRQSIANDVMCSCVGVSDPAWHLTRVLLGTPHK